MTTVAAPPPDVAPPPAPDPAPHPKRKAAAKSALTTTQTSTPPATRTQSTPTTHAVLGAVSPPRSTVATQAPTAHPRKAHVLPKPAPTRSPAVKAAPPEKPIKKQRANGPAGQPAVERANPTAGSARADSRNLGGVALWGALALLTIAVVGTAGSTFGGNFRRLRHRRRQLAWYAGAVIVAAIVGGLIGGAF